jgi:hypothetical protein
MKYALTQTRCLTFESLHRLQNTDNSALAFVYCDHTIQDIQTPTHLIGSLLGQLTNRLPENNPIVTELLMRETEEKDLDLASGIDYIRRIATSSSLSVIRLGADGLDELRKEYRSGFLHALSSLSRVPNVRFLCFGRDHSGIQSEVENFFQDLSSTTHLEITGALTVDDRQLFLEERLAKDKDGREFDEELRNLIIEKLAPLDSTYVFIECQIMDALLIIHQFPSGRPSNRRCIGSGDTCRSRGSGSINSIRSLFGLYQDAFTYTSSRT